MKTNVVKEFLRGKKYLVNYVYDKYGFRKGVVVALDKDHIGWSVVSPRDYTRYTGALTSIPAIAREIRWESSIEEISKYLTFEKGRCIIMQPKFHKEAGLYMAVERALQDNGQDQRLGRDPDLVRTVKHMIDRANKLL